MIIVTVTGPGMEDALAQISASERHADLFEMRLDLISLPSLSGLFGSTRKPIIATCRPAWQGGGFHGSEKERADMLESALLFGVDYVDVELKAPAPILRKFLAWKKGARVIVSHHLLKPARFDVGSVFKQLDDTGAEVIKFAFTPKDISECALAFEFLERAEKKKRKAIAIAMGEEGEPSRILYRKFGGWATYAAAGEGSAAASGQIPASRMKTVFRAHELRPSTKVYGVVGRVVRQSKGFFIHNELFRRASRDAVYCRFPVKNLRSFMLRIGPIVEGLSVTIPHKVAMMRYLDAVDPVAKKIGAVNTVVRRGRKLFGSNTDAPAALDAIEDVVRVIGKNMLIIGAGGAAKAIAFEAVRRGAHVTITNRTESSGKRLAARLKARYMPITSIPAGSFDIIANATSVGMVPNDDATPIPKELLTNGVVFDVVYNPPMTRLLREATGAGAKTISGTEMYLRQAAQQSELFAGRQPDITVMREMLDSLLSSNKQEQPAS